MWTMLAGFMIQPPRKRQGRERWNHLNSLPIKQIHDRWISEYATHAMSILDRLKLGLEA